MIVVDASVIVDVLGADQPSIQLRRRLLASPEPLCAPHVLDAEVSQAVRRLALRGQITEQRGLQALDDLVALPLERYGHVPLLTRVFELRENLTAYDALYVALAEATGATLWTRDRSLAVSAGRVVEVEIV